METSEKKLEENVSILLVDDRDDNLVVLEAVLGDQHYNLIKARSGREAVQLAQAKEFAVIILDVQMPIMDGFAAAKQIRGQGFSKNAPIIFVTAIYGDQEYVNLGYNVGAVDYIFKPFNPHILRSKVAVFADVYRKNKLLLRQAEALRLIESREKALKIAELEMQALRKQTLLDQSVQRLGLVIQRAPVAMFCINEKGQITLTDGRGLETLKLKKGDLVGENITTLSNDWNQFLGIVGAAQEGNDVATKIEIGSKTFDAYVTCETCNESKTRGTVVILKDVSREQLMNSASMQLSESIQFQPTMQKLIDLVTPRLADSCSIHLKEDEVSAKTMSFPIAAYSSEVSGAVVKVISSGLSHFTSQLISVPLRVRGCTLGVLVCRKQNAAFKTDDLEILEELARRGATAIDNARLYRNAEKAVQTRDEFMSIAAHELRTPLTPLKIQFQTLLKLMRDGRFSNLSEETLVTMLLRSDRQIDRIANLIEDFLNVSRINMGRLTIDRHQTDLTKLIRDVTEQFREQLSHSKCELAVELNDSIQGVWDSFKIEQVIVNLLTNAIKYGAGAPIKIRATENQNTAEFTVEDHGIGIADSDQERIFDLFERAVSPRNYGGLGLGLYIVKNIVTEHGGTIAVKSNLGGGSSFTVQLPKVSVNKIPTLKTALPMANALKELH